MHPMEPIMPIMPKLTMMVQSITMTPTTKMGIIRLEVTRLREPDIVDRRTPTVATQLDLVLSPLLPVGLDILTVAQVRRSPRR